MISARELLHVARSMGDVAYSASGSAPGRYTAEHATFQLVEGTAPAFTAPADALTDAGIVRGARIERIERHNGDAVGPFIVRGVEPEGDGDVVILVLQQTT